MKDGGEDRMARQLAKLGVDTSKLVPNFVPRDLEAVQAVAREVRDVPVAALARQKKLDIDAAIEALKTSGGLAFAYFPCHFRPSPAVSSI